MKKRIYVFMASLLILSMLAVGVVGCGTKTEIPEPTITVASLDTRLVTVETWRTQLIQLWPSMATNDYVDSRVAAVASPDLSVYATKTELAAYATDADLNNFIANLTDDQIAALKTKLGLPSGGSTTGQVTVTIGTTTEPYIFTSGTTTAQYVFPIKITNGTANYQKVTFGLILQCISVDHKADITPGYSLTLTGVIFTPTEVAPSPNCQLVYLTWTAGEGIPIAPSAEASYFVTLNSFGTILLAELWEVSVTNVIVTQL